MKPALRWSGTTRPEGGTTATLLLGPAGTGKSAIAAQFAAANAARGEHVSLFLFEERGGTVNADSGGLDKGSELIVTLPVTDVPVNGPVSNKRAPRATHPPRRIVVVDDNDDLREMLEGLLVSAGHEVSTAHDGPSGLDRILDRKPDVALVDLGLPGFDGYELARRVRAGGQRVVLVAVSGYGQPEDRQRALAAGFDEHLKKPVAFAELESALAREELPYPRP